MDFVRPIEAIIPGAQGRVLSVLVETTAELNLRTVARLAGISPAQASRVLPDLVGLGVVERREVPPSSLFRLVPEHVASRALLRLAGSTDSVLERLGALSTGLKPSPSTVVVFGSFARREARADSDIDVVMVRSPGMSEEDDDAWNDSVEQWRQTVERISGNRVEILEVSVGEARARLAERSELWSAIRRDGCVVYGAGLDELEGAGSA